MDPFVVWRTLWGRLRDDARYLFLVENVIVIKIIKKKSPLFFVVLWSGYNYVQMFGASSRRAAGSIILWGEFGGTFLKREEKRACVQAGTYCSVR